MKRYLVTGGAGFIGSAITKRLLKQKHFVRVLDNESRGSMSKLHSASSKLEFFPADIRDLAAVSAACKGIDSIIHLAFVNGTRNFYEKPDLVLSVGVKGMLNVLDGAQKHGVSELFLASSSEVYQNPPLFPTPETVPYSIPDPLNPRYSYAGGKIISELLTLHVGKAFLKRIVIFRPHNVYGPNMGKDHVIPELIIKLYKNGKSKQKNISLRIQGTGDETRAFIYIDDFVDCLMLLLQKGKRQEIYNIGTSEEIAIKDLVGQMSKIIKKNIMIVTSKKLKGSANRRFPDIKKITKLGFVPKISLYEGLRKTMVWYNTHA